MAAVLRDLGLPADTEEVRFGFWGPRGVTQDVTPGERAEYLRRSGRPAAAPSSAVSSGAPGLLTCFRTTVDALCAALEARVRVWLGKVSFVRPEPATGRVRVEAGDELYETGLLVNTLPAPAFDGLLRREGTWCIGRKSFAEGMAWADALRVARDAGLRWVYVTDPRIPFDRVTILPGGTFAYEFNGDTPPWFPEVVNGSWVVRDALLQVLGEPRPAEESGGLVRHMGRMARWDHRIRLHDVAEEALRDLVSHV
jgi:hypothetical protein